MARPTAGGSGHQHDPVAFAVHFQDAVSVFLAEVDDVGAGGFEDPQAEQPEHGDQGEVVRVARLAGGCEHGLELQVGQPECGRLGWHVGSADMLGRRGGQHPVDDAGAEEAGDDRDPAGHGGGLEPAYLLHPADVERDVRALGSQWLEPAFGAPAQEHPQVGLGVGTRQALVAGEVPGHSPTKNIGPFDGDRQRQNFHRGSHALDCAPSGMSGSC
jgi:hypothetical protein